MSLGSSCCKPWLNPQPNPCNFHSNTPLLKNNNNGNPGTIGLDCLSELQWSRYVSFWNRSNYKTVGPSFEEIVSHLGIPFVSRERDRHLLHGSVLWRFSLNIVFWLYRIVVLCYETDCCTCLVVGKKSWLVRSVDGPSVSEVNHVVFTDKTGYKDIGVSEK